MFLGDTLCSFGLFAVKIMILTCYCKLVVIGNCNHVKHFLIKHNLATATWCTIEADISLQTFYMTGNGPLLMK